jgi:hypothetical protein
MNRKRKIKDAKQASILGIASVAVGFRAESPAIISTGQRPVDAMPRMQLSPERAKSCETNRIPPFQGYGDGLPLFTGQRPVVFGRKCRPCAVRHNMLVENTGRRPSPRPVWDGMWVEKRKRYNISGNTFRPDRDGWRNCIGYFVFYQHIVPTAQGEMFLLGVASTLRRAKSKAPALQSRDGARPVSTTAGKGRTILQTNII